MVADLAPLPLVVSSDRVSRETLLAVVRERDEHRLHSEAYPHCAVCRDGDGRPLPWPCGMYVALDRVLDLSHALGQ